MDENLCNIIGDAIGKAYADNGINTRENILLFWDESKKECHIGIEYLKGATINVYDSDLNELVIRNSRIEKFYAWDNDIEYSDVTKSFMKALNEGIIRERA